MSTKAGEVQGKTEIDRLSIAELRNQSISFSKLESKRVAVLDGQAAWWVIDSQGNLRAVLGYTDSEVILLYRESNEAKWVELQHMAREEDESDLDQRVIPVGMAADGENLIVVAYNRRNTRGIYEYNIETHSIDRALYHNPEHDVEDVTRDYSRVRILSATYRRRGVLHHHYFEDPVESRRAELQDAFPGKSVRIASTSSDGAYAIVFVSGAQDPGHFYYLNMRLGTRVELASAAPWIQKSDTSPVEALRVTTKDGLEIEAFLTLPSHSCDAKSPLVVLPHGGPIGVQDVKEFDPLVQFLAASGLAVLQVNYRGSAGYGRDFERAGKREQGAGIEDDIDAALAAALMDDRVDAERLCIAGGSYGGYSALMSVLRWPDRYRCAASIAGIVDLPLQYDSADFTDYEEGRKYFVEYQGDPETEYEYLKSISPLYRASEFAIPLLIVHGTEDRRVDVEHGYRMHLILEKLNKLHTWHPISGAEHNLSDDEWPRLARLLRKFLTSHLKPSVSRTSAVMGELGCTTVRSTGPGATTAIPRHHHGA